MPTIKDILQEERNRESGQLVLFLEGKFWKAYEQSALEIMLEVKLYVRILHDSKQLSLKKYALLCEQMVAVEKNLTVWKKYYMNKIN